MWILVGAGNLNPSLRQRKYFMSSEFLYVKHHLLYSSTKYENLKIAFIFCMLRYCLLPHFFFNSSGNTAAMEYNHSNRIDLWLILAWIRRFEVTKYIMPVVITNIRLNTYVNLSVLLNLLYKESIFTWSYRMVISPSSMFSLSIRSKLVHFLLHTPAQQKHL